MSDDFEDRLRGALDREAGRIPVCHADGPRRAKARPWWHRRETAGAGLLAVAALVAVMVAVATTGGSGGHQVDVSSGPARATTPARGSNASLLPDFCAVAEPVGQAGTPAPTLATLGGCPTTNVPGSVSGGSPGVTTTSTTVPAPTTSTTGPKRLTPVVPGGPITAPAAGSTAAATSCSIALGVGGPVSEQTQHVSIELTLTDIGTAPCTLDGYPSVGATGGGTAVAFAYQTGGSDPMITSAAPQPVTIAPAGVAYVRLDKSSCTLGDQIRVTSIALGGAGLPTGLVVGAPSEPDVSSCQTGSGVPDQNVVYLSPVEATSAATG